MDTKLKHEFIESLKEIPGIDAEALRVALDTPPAIAIRLNRRKYPTDTAAISDMEPLYPDMQRVEWCNSGFRLPQRPSFTLNPLLHCGAFYVQDPSSMIYQQIVEKLTGRLDNPSLCVLDFCAAPGGKTTAIINALPDGSAVVANEYVPARGRILRENLEKWGFPNIITTGASSAEYARLPMLFDIVAVDAPCSGEGMMRKDADARSQWSSKLTQDCAALQRDILSDVAKTLKPGGYLIYSTCTFNTLEDESNSLFIEKELGLKPIAIDTLALSGVESAGRAALSGVEALRFMPHLTNGEGIYISIFQAPNDYSSCNYYFDNNYSDDNYFDNKIRDKCKFRKVDKKRKGNGKGKVSGKAERGILSKDMLSKDMLGQLAEWFAPEYNMQFSERSGLVSALPGELLPISEALQRAGIHITGLGLPAAELKRNLLTPDSRLPLSMAFKRGAFPEVELSPEQALQFLRRESFPLPAYTAENSSGCNKGRGFVVVKYKGLPLGMMKNLGSRANNLFPQAWKIRI